MSKTATKAVAQKWTGWIGLVADNQERMLPHWEYFVDNFGGAGGFNVFRSRKEARKRFQGVAKVRIVPF